MRLHAPSAARVRSTDPAGSFFTSASSPIAIGRAAAAAAEAARKAASDASLGARISRHRLTSKEASEGERALKRVLSRPRTARPPRSRPRVALRRPATASRRRGQPDFRSRARHRRARKSPRSPRPVLDERGRQTPRAVRAGDERSSALADERWESLFGKGHEDLLKMSLADWLAGFEEERSSFSSFSLFVELKLRQCAKLTASQSTPNPLRTAVVSYLMQETVKLVGQYGPLLRLLLEELLSSIYHSFKPAKPMETSVAEFMDFSPFFMDYQQFQLEKLEMEKIITSLEVSMREEGKQTEVVERWKAGLVTARSQAREEQIRGKLVASAKELEAERTRDPVTRMTEMYTKLEDEQVERVFRHVFRSTSGNGWFSEVLAEEMERSDALSVVKQVLRNSEDFQNEAMSDMMVNCLDERRVELLDLAFSSIGVELPGLLGNTFARMDDTVQSRVMREFQRALGLSTSALLAVSSMEKDDASLLFAAIGPRFGTEMLAQAASQYASQSNSVRLMMLRNALDAVNKPAVGVRHENSALLQLFEQAPEVTQTACQTDDVTIGLPAPALEEDEDADEEATVAAAAARVKSAGRYALTSKLIQRHLRPPKKHVSRVMSLPVVCNTILEVVERRMNQLERVIVKGAAAPPPLPEFVFDCLIEKYGLKSTASRHFHDLLHSLSLYKGNSRVLCFSWMLGLSSPFFPQLADLYCSALSPFFKDAADLKNRMADPFRVRLCWVPLSEALSILYTRFQRSVPHEITDKLHSLAGAADCSSIVDERAGIQRVKLHEDSGTELHVDLDAMMAVLLEYYVHQLSRKRERLIALFHHCDENGDGVLAYDEFKHMLSFMGDSLEEEETMALFKQVVRQCKGDKITTQAFLLMCSSRNLDVADDVEFRTVATASS